MSKPTQLSPIPRCEWCGSHDDYIEYHDLEWGVPIVDDVELFELLTLEGAQAGLSWLTILRKRDGYRKAFAGFDPTTVSKYSASKAESLRADPSIVRNRLKIESTITNAEAFLTVQKDYGSFAAYLWKYVDGVPIQNDFESMRDVPAKTALAEQLSKDLKKKGFRFVGPTIVYAFLQSAGLVNDHVQSCYRYSEVKSLGQSSVIDLG